MKLTNKIVKKYSLFLHIAGWLAFFLLPYLFFPFNFSQPFSSELIFFILTNLVSYVIQIIFFYVNLKKITPASLRKNNILPIIWGILTCAILIMVSLSVSNIFLADIMPVPKENAPFPPRENLSFSPGGNPPPLFIRSAPAFPLPHIIFLLLVAGVSSGIALWNDLMKTREMKQQMELEKLTSELAILKLQIGPHFLFNTLNNICWLARTRSVLTEDALISLSQILRYVLYKGDKDKVPLDQDVAYLYNYIKLQSMRISEHNTVKFVCEGSMENIRIEPLLFVPLVENAFKHGLHSQHVSTIQIELKIKDGVISFFISNPIFPENTGEHEDSGIGLVNVKRRLELHYPESHQLVITNYAGYFDVNLKIYLDK